MAARRSHRLSWLLLLVLSVGSLWFYRATRDPWPAQQGVAVPPGEELETARIVASAVALVDSAHVEGRPYTRAMNAKAHGCVRATLSVLALEPRLRHGLFAKVAEYPAWIRFSSGDMRLRSDQLRDVRGLALKVMGVAGRKLLEAERDADTQDFLLANSQRSPIANVHELAELLDDLSRGERYGYFFRGSWLPWRWRVRELYLAARMLKAPPASLLQTRYYSVTPYRLGPDQHVKYGVRPCESRRPPRRDRTENMLREDLKQQLAQGDACLELLVQPQVPGRNMPIEDPTVLWSEQDSPFVPVARITIPKQAFDTPAQERLCEDLSFSPWHALPEHEPVGGLNRLRKALYLEVSRYRHARNQAPLAEPQGFCLDLSGASCPAGEGRPAPPSQPHPAATASPRPATPLPRPEAGPAVPTPEATPSPTPAEEKPPAVEPAPTPPPESVPPAPAPTPTPTPPPPGRTP